MLNHIVIIRVQLTRCVIILQSHGFFNDRNKRVLFAIKHTCFLYTVLRSIHMFKTGSACTYDFGVWILEN